jgi:hypothetical protein
MGRKLEWELSGKSDVPEKMAKAKASMEGLEGAANGLSKKFREAFKDIAVGFLAPMVLIQKALSFISDKIAQAKQDAQEARDFAKDEESKGYMKGGARSVLNIATEREAEAKRQAKAKLAEQLAYEDFLLNDPRGKELLKQNVPASAIVASQVVPYNPFTSSGEKERREFQAGETAKLPGVRAAIEAMVAGDALGRMKPEAPGAAEGGMTASKIPELASNVIGVGMSPQLDIANKQLTVQEDMANSLRTLIERDQAQSGFTPEKFFPSSRRLNLPR